MKHIVESSFSADSILLSQQPRTLREAIKNRAISLYSYWNYDSNNGFMNSLNERRSYSDSTTVSGSLQYVSQSEKIAQNSSENSDYRTLYGGIKTDSKSNQQNPIVCITNEAHPQIEQSESEAEPIQDDLFTQDQWRQVPADVKRYIRLNVAGRFYESLAELWGIERNDAKKAFMFILFGKNRGWYKTEKMFAVEFPRTYRFIREKKKWGYKFLSVELQRQESNLVLDLTCTRLMEEYPEIPLWTIHDSIITTAEHIDLVEQILREECALWYGAEPNLKREYWADIRAADVADREKVDVAGAEQVAVSPLEIPPEPEAIEFTSVEAPVDALTSQKDTDVVYTEDDEVDEDYRKKLAIVRRVEQLLAEEKPERKPVNLSALIERAEEKFRERYGISV
jgi:hypothetical protein